MLLSIFGISLQNILFYMLPLFAISSALNVYERIETDKILFKLFPFCAAAVVILSCIQIYHKGLIDQEAVPLMTQMVIFSLLLSAPMPMKSKK